jgi:hypothetical protein
VPLSVSILVDPEVNTLNRVDSTVPVKDQLTFLLQFQNVCSTAADCIFFLNSAAGISDLFFFFSVDQMDKMSSD